MHYADLATDLTATLDLTTPPVALAFAETSPAGIQSFAGEVPSACTFSRRAENGVFFAPAIKHFNCPIGALTMGFDLPETVQQDLMAAVTLMCDAGYISPAEPAQIPSTGRKSGGIVYGPLRDFPVEPELILMWLTPRQAMVFSEATGGAQWTAPRPATVFGRPTCAALPVALAEGRATLSLGCEGMRTFTAIADDRLLVTVPAAAVAELAGALAATRSANAAMHDYYAQKQAAFA